MKALDPGVPILSETALEDRIKRHKRVAVLFYADWCPFCAQFLPEFARRVAKLGLDVVAANVSHPMDPRWDAYNIEAVPTIVAFQAGREASRLGAARGKGLTVKELDAYAAKVAR